MSGKRIGVDAGHGYPDPGAVGPAGTEEAVVTHAVAQEVARILRGEGYEVVLTRTGSRALASVKAKDLAARCQIANNARVECFVSVHCNAADDPLAEGMEVWTSPGRTEADDLAVEIRRAWRRAFPKAVIRGGDGSKEARFHVLVGVKAPAALVELDFISCPEREPLLADPGHQQAMARALAAGIVAWCNEQSDPD